MIEKNRVVESNFRYFLIFKLAQKEFALPIEDVNRVVHAVQITTLPKAPEIVKGLINFKGSIIPIINISKRFNIQENSLNPRQHFIIIESKKKPMAIVADSIISITEINNDNLVQPNDIVSGVKYLSGVLKTKTGMILIPDVKKILHMDEEIALKEAMKESTKKKSHDKRTK